MQRVLIIVQQLLYQW